MRGKRIGVQKRNLSDFHIRGELKIKGEKYAMRECINCHKVLPSTEFNTWGADFNSSSNQGIYRLRTYCRKCQSIMNAEARLVKKNAPPKPERCERCHKKTKSLNTDHLHGTTIFRGWLCANCNTSIGKLGDNLEGVLQAAIYLENDKNKIIETLHKVYNEMFARTT